MKRRLELSVNGETHCLEIEPYKRLLDVLREDLGLTGTKEGCGAGECGACSVLLDGKLVCSCMVLALQANGKEVETIEGLACGGNLHPLQEAFLRHGAVQCGFCTPGLIISAKSFLDENPRPTEEEVREAIAGNLCRCTGYQKIVDAILEVARLGDCLEGDEIDEPCSSY